MKDYRALGNAIKYYADQNSVSIEDLASILNQSVENVKMGLAGRKLFSYQQIEAMAQKINVPVANFFNPDNIDHSAYTMDCMNCFTHEKNKEKILDIIYDYLDVYDAVCDVNKEGQCV